jgi:hypothetical protein
MTRLVSPCRRFWVVCCVLCLIPLAIAEDLKPEELVAKHLQSLGKTEVLQAVKSRAVTGTALLQFVLGATGNLSGPAHFVSEGSKLALLMQFGARQYPAENLAFDGKDVTVAYIDHGVRSPLGNFISVYADILKEGLLGGTLSTAWPLLHYQQSQAKLKVKRKAAEGRDVYEVEYKPKKGFNNVTVNMAFDATTFRHLQTDYKVRIASVNVGQRGDTSDTIYLLREQFEDYGEVEGLTLPNTYTLHYSSESRTQPLIANWVIKTAQWRNNATIEPKLFNAEK